MVFRIPRVLKGELFYSTDKHSFGYYGVKKLVDDLGGLLGSRFIKLAIL